MQCFSCGFRLCVCAFVLLSLSLHCNVRGPVGVTRHLFKRGRKQPYGVAPDSLHDQTHSADTSLCTEDVSEDVPDFPLTLDSGGHGVDEGVVLFLFRSQTGHQPRVRRSAPGLHCPTRPHRPPCLRAPLLRTTVPVLDSRLVRSRCWPSKIPSSWHHALHPRVQCKHTRFTPELCRRACSKCLDCPSMCSESDDVPCIAHLRHRVQRQVTPATWCTNPTEHPFSVRACIRR